MVDGVGAKKGWGRWLRKGTGEVQVIETDTGGGLTAEQAAQKIVESVSQGPGQDQVQGEHGATDLDRVGVEVDAGPEQYEQGKGNLRVGSAPIMRWRLRKGPKRWR